MKAIAFDLDDTLLMTSQLMVPVALRELSKHLKDSYDFHCSPSELRMQKREYEYKRRSAHFFKNLSLQICDLNQSTTLDAKQIEEQILSVMYERTVNESEVRLFPGVDEFLRQLSQQKNLMLFLITAGADKTQKRKIELTKLSPYFSEIIVIDYRSQTTKKQSFEQLLDKYAFAPEDMLIVGDRYMNEIVSGNSLGCPTAWIQTGEHASEIEADEVESDFTFKTITELIEAWPLPNRVS